jgi:tetratricopeptide (TPR) repeat protein
LRRFWHTVISSLGCVALVSGCASLAPQSAALGESGLPQGVPESFELATVPFFPQDEYQCGPAALATAMAAAGVKITPQELVPEVYLPERKGSLQIEMLAAARRHGLVSYQLAPSFVDLLREVAAGTPVIVLQNLGLSEGWHYAVVVGYSTERLELILRSGETERSIMPFTLNEIAWRRSGYWAMVAVPPDRIPVSAEATRWLAAVAALERTGDKARARLGYQASLKRWPDNVNASIGLANTWYADGNLKEAEQVLRAALEREPGSPVVLNNLAQTLSDQGRDQEALPLIERAVAAGGPLAEEVRKTRQAILEKISRQK